MKINESEIESALRSAPRPTPPAGLKSQLTAQITLASTGQPTRTVLGTSTFGGWLRRWWPALAPASASLACGAIMLMQQVQVQALQQDNHRLFEEKTSLQASRTNASVTKVPSRSAVAANLSEAEEVARLKERAAQLTTEIARLENLKSEDATLSKQSTATRTLTEEELGAVNKARDRAWSVQCVNNLKQVGLAVRVWSLDNKDQFPPDFLSMTNELGTPKLLTCPADTNRLAATSFAAYADANGSYEFLGASASDTEPTRVLTRCPIHGTVGLCDGSVQMGAWLNHRDWFVERDGKLYFEPPTTPQPKR